MIRIFKTHGTMTASSGAASASITFLNHICLQILLKPATLTTTYNAKLTDTDSMDIWESNGNTGKLNHLVTLPCASHLVLSVTSASADEAFDWTLNFQESS